MAGCSDAGTDVDPAPEWALKGYVQQTAECLKERGWDVVYHEYDDSIEGFFPPSQEERCLADSRECRIAAGEPTGTPPPLTDVQLTVLYQHYLEQADCLREHGVDVPEAPSEQVFKDLYGTPDIWAPFKFYSPRGKEEDELIFRDCPQVPEGW